MIIAWKPLFNRANVESRNLKFKIILIIMNFRERRIETAAVALGADRGGVQRDKRQGSARARVERVIIFLLRNYYGVVPPRARGATHDRQPLGHLHVGSPARAWSHL